jgi:hypothetical protein
VNLCKEWKNFSTYNWRAGIMDKEQW